MSRLAVLTLLTALLASSALAQALTATAPLKNGKGEEVGKVTLTAAPKGVLIRIEAKGLTPGWHGLHLHEKADCSKADFTSAGAHTHGGGERVHGLLNPKASETGDLPNIHVGKDGMAAAEIFTPLTTFAALKDADGSGVIVHAGPDDHMAQPIGGSGARVACAEIK